MEKNLYRYMFYKDYITLESSPKINSSVEQTFLSSLNENKNDCILRNIYLTTPRVVFAKL